MNIEWRAWILIGDAILRADSEHWRWEDLPDDGVLFVMVYHGVDQHGTVLRRQLSGDDWYFLQRVEGRQDLLASNRDSPKTNRRRYPGCVLKRGAWVDDATFRRIQEEAMDRGSDLVPTD